MHNAVEFAPAIKVKEIDMTANVGRLDRILRLIVGAFLIMAPMQNVIGSGTNPIFAYVLIGVGAVLVLTSIFGVCPIYRLLRIKTGQ
ncbi:MAG: putative membrane protein [Yoonia sp.]